MEGLAHVEDVVHWDFKELVEEKFEDIHIREYHMKKP